MSSAAARHVWMVVVVACSPAPTPATRVTIGRPEASTQASTEKEPEKEPAPDPDDGVWHEVDSVPDGGVPPVAAVDEPAQVGRLCPSRARVFRLQDGRALVVREPCSRSPVAGVAIRQGDAEHPVSGFGFTMLPNKSRAWPLSRHRALLVYDDGPYTPTALFVVDLGAAHAEFLHLPRELESAHAYGIDVAVVRGDVFLSGGMVRVPVGTTDCGRPPPHQMCDPAVITTQQPNHAIFVVRPAHR